MTSTDKIIKDMKWINTVTPTGGALWCKVLEPDYKFDKQGRYETTLVLNPDVEESSLFIGKITNYLTEQADKIIATLPARKASEIKIVAPFSKEYDKEDNETGKLLFKSKSTASFKDEKIIIPIYDAKGNKLDNFKKAIGNGSSIRLYVSLKPYFLNNNIGLAIRLKKLQIIELREYVVEEDVFKDTTSNVETEFEDSEFDF